MFSFFGNQNRQAKQNSEIENLKDRRRRLEEGRKQQIEFKHNISQEFDKTLITLSSAILTLSMGFLTKEHSQFIYICFLWLSWALLVLTVILLVIAPLASIEAFDQAINISDIKFRALDLPLSDQDKEDLKKKENICKSIGFRVRKLNKIAALTFCMGLISLIIFSALNFNKIQQKMSNEQISNNHPWSNVINPPDIRETSTPITDTIDEVPPPPADAPKGK